MATEIEYRNSESQQEPFVYRALSAAAVSCFAFGLLSLLALFDWWLVIIPLIGLVVGIGALSTIRKRPDELTGKVLAKLGIAFCVVSTIGSISLHTYIYMTEVPDGCERISWEQLQPDDNSVNQPIPASAKALDGEYVFLKGYIFPVTGGRKTGIPRFLLVRDQGSCCFGGDPKMTERIQVSVADSKGATYTTGVCKVAGIFRIKHLNRVDGAEGVKRGIIYHLEKVEIR